MASQSETNVNNALGRLLKSMMPVAEVRAEHYGLIGGQPGLRLDNLVTAADRSPVVIEAEFEPAHKVEAEAKGRLGFQVEGEGQIIETAVALKYPKALKAAGDLDRELGDAELAYCVYHSSYERFPLKGWIEGDVRSLAELVQLESIPRKAAVEFSKNFELGINLAEPILHRLDNGGSNSVKQIAKGVLGMKNVEQMRRMACAIVLNAMVFHEHVASSNPIVPYSRLVDADGRVPKSVVMNTWREILKIDFWPIFATAKKIVKNLPNPAAEDLLATLWRAAETVCSNGILNSHNMIGRVFQRLITDRKYLATFYTLPSSATFLAKIAIDKLDNIEWDSRDSVANLRVGDFACGTGALLMAAYQDMQFRYEAASHSAESLHSTMIEQMLTGCDVMPSAVHITASTLSGAHPDMHYDRTRLFTLPYGRMNGQDTLALGSLELLNSNSTPTMINTSQPAVVTGPKNQTESDANKVEIQDASFDLVIMNPPFTSNTKHRDAESGVIAAAFAAFDAPEEDQTAMAEQMGEKAKGTCYHGHAGLGSAFAALANAKLKPGGVIALVLPLTALRGSAWKEFRKMLATKFTDLTLVSLTGEEGEISFSADTGLAECLVVGRKLRDGESPEGRAEFISLSRRPSDVAQAVVMAQSSGRGGNARNIEDGPFGGTRISVGDEVVGELVSAPVPPNGDGYGCARLRDAAVGQVAHSLSELKLWLPGQSAHTDVPLAHLEDLGSRGHDSQMFVGTQQNGPFEKLAISGEPTYPALWNRKGHAENSFIYEPDCELQVKEGQGSRALELWASASRFHVAREFGFSQDQFCAVLTDRATIGGRSWPTYSFPDPRIDALMAIWFNSTLGMLNFWWTSSRQQDTRGSLTITTMGKLVVPDYRSLEPSILDLAAAKIDEIRGMTFEPAFRSQFDPSRNWLDKLVIREMLKLGNDTLGGVKLLAKKWYFEPSVRRAKSNNSDDKRYLGL